MFKTALFYVCKSGRFKRACSTIATTLQLYSLAFLPKYVRHGPDCYIDAFPLDSSHE